MAGNRSRTKRLALAIAHTDKTFERVEHQGHTFWQGKCIHCNSKLTICEDGTLWHHATIEHIIPKSKGGTDDLKNIALACSCCNFEKGVRHDNKKNKRSQEIVQQLLKRRLERWKDDEANSQYWSR